MAVNAHISAEALEQIRKNPTHAVLLDLGRAAAEADRLQSPEFKKLVSYLLEQADNRDRRDTMVNKPGEPIPMRGGVLRPVPKLRAAVDACFGPLADLHWFRLNKTANESKVQLRGLFARMSASVTRVSPEDFGDVVGALVSKTPDHALLKLLHARSGSIKGMGLELFSRLAFAFRRDLYFLLPKPWADVSGTVTYIGDDLRKYCVVCRSLRAVCDEMGIPEEYRASVFDKAMSQEPVHPGLLTALNRKVSSTVGRASTLDPADGYEPAGGYADPSALPLEFGAVAIRARRGDRRLRDALLRAYNSQCAITGACVKDLLEIAYVVPFPTMDVNSIENAILLRTDLHTLWDLNLIGVEPETGRVHIAKRLAGSVYEKIVGRSLVPRIDNSRVSHEALKERWDSFVNAHKERVAQPVLPKTPVEVMPPGRRNETETAAAVGAREPVMSRQTPAVRENAPTESERRIPSLPIQIRPEPWRIPASG